MPERHPTHHISEADLLALPVDPPQIDIPVIEIPDVAQKDKQRVAVEQIVDEDTTRDAIAELEEFIAHHQR